MGLARGWSVDVRKQIVQWVGGGLGVKGEGGVITNQFMFYLNRFSHIWQTFQVFTIMIINENKNG